MDKVYVIMGVLEGKYGVYRVCDTWEHANDWYDVYRNAGYEVCSIQPWHVAGAPHSRELEEREY